MRRTARGTHVCSSSPVSLHLPKRLNVFETKYHTSLYMGCTIMRSEPWAGWGRRERCTLNFWVPLNVAVNPLHAETWVSLPDSHFQEGPLPNTEFPAYAKCSGKGSRSWWSSQNMNQQSSIMGRPGTVFVKLSHSWRNGVIISYELNCSVKGFSSRHKARTLVSGPVQVEERG